MTGHGKATGKAVIATSEKAKISQTIDARLFRRLGRWFAAALYFAIWPCLAVAEMPLQPGDPLRATVTGLVELSVETRVDLDGDLDLNWLGRFRAEGKTLSELEFDIRQDASGQIVKQYDRDGEIFIIQLDGNDIELSRNGYRPIVVGGDVANAGEVAFRPGLTTRDAVSLSGGPQSRLLNEETVVDPVQLVRWQSEFGLAALEHASATVRHWRASTEIDEDLDSPPPTVDGVSVSERVLSDLVREQERVRQINLDTKKGQFAFFEKAREQAGARIDILKRQQEELESALESDEQEEERVAKLVERGLAPGSRLAESRRTTVLTATRLLDVEEALAAAELALTRLQRDRDADEEQRALVLLTVRDEASTAARRARVRMDAISPFLLGGQTTDGVGDILADIDYSVTIYRRISGQIEAITVEKSEILLPGDTIEVSVDSTKRLSELTD